MFPDETKTIVNYTLIVTGLLLRAALPNELGCSCSEQTIKIPSEAARMSVFGLDLQCPIFVNPDGHKMALATHRGKWSRATKRRSRVFTTSNGESGVEGSGRDPDYGHGG